MLIMRSKEKPTSKVSLPMPFLRVLETRLSCLVTFQPRRLVMFLTPSARDTWPLLVLSSGGPSLKPLNRTGRVAYTRGRESNLLLDILKDGFSVLRRNVRNQVIPWQVEYLRRSLLTVFSPDISPWLNQFRIRDRTY